MFLKISQSEKLKDIYEGLEHAKIYIEKAKKYQSTKSGRDYGMLCGNDGIYAVSALVSHYSKDRTNCSNDLKRYAERLEFYKTIDVNEGIGSDEMLVGRAGFLSGAYWLNENLGFKVFDDKKIQPIIETMIQSGRDYKTKVISKFPLMYQYHNCEYLGAAHGLSSILQMILQSNIEENINNFYVKKSIDDLLSLQNSDGNFQTKMKARTKQLVHWCHGAPGIIYLFAKAYLIYGEEKYLKSCQLSADLVWREGLLYKGPGICHGVAGNGYVFLLMYRLTKDKKYLYQASKFMEFLTKPLFICHSATPDCPLSLYEGVAGTVCFLVDLLDPEKSSFPFMNVFYQ